MSATENLHNSKLAWSLGQQLLFQDKGLAIIGFWAEESPLPDLVDTQRIMLARKPQPEIGTKRHRKFLLEACRSQGLV